MQGSLGIEQMCQPAQVSRAGFYRSLQEQRPVQEEMEVRSHQPFSLLFPDMPKLNSSAHRYLCLRFKRYLVTSPARLEAGMDSLLSFPVGLFHPRQHAGLSRRTLVCRPSAQYPPVPKF
jgi:hypothetical protein